MEEKTLGGEIKEVREAWTELINELSKTKQGRLWLKAVFATLDLLEKLFEGEKRNGSFRQNKK